MTRPLLLASLAVLLLATRLATPAAAQTERTRGVPLMRLDYQLSGLGIDVERDEEQRESAPLRFHSLFLDAQLPVPIAGTRSILIAGLSHRSLFVHTDEGATVAEGTRYMAATSLRVSLRQQIREKWALIPTLSFGLASDFEGLGQQDLFGSGSMLVTHRFSPRFSMGGGLILSCAADGVLPLPAFLLKWAPRDDVWVDLLLPYQLQVGVRPTERLELAFETRMDGSSYTLHGIAGVERARYARVMMGASVAVHVGRGFFLRASGGLHTPVTFDIEGRTDDGPGVKTGDANWYAEFGLAFRVFPSRPEPRPSEDPGHIEAEHGHAAVALGVARRDGTAGLDVDELEP